MPAKSENGDAERQEPDGEADAGTVRPFRSRLLLPTALPFRSAQERRWWWNYRGAGRAPEP